MVLRQIVKNFTVADLFKKRERRGNRGRHLDVAGHFVLPWINKNENVKTLRYGAVSGIHEGYSIYLGWRAVYFAL